MPDNALAASGHATTAPPSAASNSRRPMVTVIRPSRARCVGNGTTPRACSLHVQRGQDAACCRPRSKAKRLGFPLCPEGESILNLARQNTLRPTQPNATAHPVMAALQSAGQGSGGAEPDRPRSSGVQAQPQKLFPAPQRSGRSFRQVGRGSKVRPVHPLPRTGCGN